MVLYESHGLNPSFGVKPLNRTTISLPRISRTVQGNLLSYGNFQVTSYAPRRRGDEALPEKPRRRPLRRIIYPIRRDLEHIRFMSGNQFPMNQREIPQALRMSPGDTGGSEASCGTLRDRFAWNGPTAHFIPDEPGSGNGAPENHVPGGRFRSRRGLFPGGLQIRHLSSQVVSERRKIAIIKHAQAGLERTALRPVRKP